MCLINPTSSFLPYANSTTQQKTTRMIPNATPWWATEEVRRVFRNHSGKLEESSFKEETKGAPKKEPSLSKQSSVDLFVSVRSKPELVETKTTLKKPYFLPLVDRDRPIQRGESGFVGGERSTQARQKALHGPPVLGTHRQTDQARQIQCDQDEGVKEDFEIVDPENEEASEHNGLRRRWWKAYRR